MKRKRWLASIVLIAAICALVPSYLRVYRVEGSSDAPSFLVGDRILVAKAAYDIRLPYTDLVLVSHAQPQRGDVVLFRPPGQEYLVFKRVIGCPGDTVSMRGAHLEVNGAALQYEQVDGSEFRVVADGNDLGTVIEEESGNGSPHWIAYSPDREARPSFTGVRLAEEQYFVMGDNRDNSTDSRDYGAIPRASIHGKVIRTFRSERVVYAELGLIGPCRVESWELYLDGGSRGGVIKDAEGHRLEVSWDNRMRILGEDDLSAPGLAYIHAQHPTYPGAVALPMGSAAELELVSLFDRWVLTQIPAGELDEWLSIYFDYSIPREQRLEQLPKLSESQVIALAVAQTSRYLKEQRELGYAPGSRE